MLFLSIFFVKLLLMLYIHDLPDDMIYNAARYADYTTF